MTKKPKISLLLSAFLIFCAYILNGCFNNNSSGNSVSGKQLVVTHQCKPLENQCEILGEGVKLYLQFKTQPSYQRLFPIALESKNNPLDSASMMLVIGGKEMPPVELKSSADKKYWRASLMPFAEVTKDNLVIHLSVSYETELYTAKFPIAY